jgi:hypothetical protein
MGQASGLTCWGAAGGGCPTVGSFAGAMVSRGWTGRFTVFLRLGCRCPLSVSEAAVSRGGPPGRAARKCGAGWHLRHRGVGLRKFLKPAQRRLHRPGPMSGPSSGRSAGPLPEGASPKARGHPLAQGLGNPAAPGRAGANAPAPGRAGAAGFGAGQIQRRRRVSCGRGQGGIGG